jgi:hypothetical protein
MIDFMAADGVTGFGSADTVNECEMELFLPIHIPKLHRLAAAAVSFVYAEALPPHDVL